MADPREQQKENKVSETVKINIDTYGELSDADVEKVAGTGCMATGPVVHPPLTDDPCGSGGGGVRG
jgi:hypothetical protein